jgi:hypothetical protein
MLGIADQRIDVDVFESSTVFLVLSIHTEEDARNMWDAGNAAFMRNWQYAYRFSAEEGSGLRDRLGMAPMGYLLDSGRRNIL